MTTTYTCGPACWTAVICNACAKEIPPVGRSLPAGIYCRCNRTRDRHLWNIHDPERGRVDPDGWAAHKAECDYCKAAR